MEMVVVVIAVVLVVGVVVVVVVVGCGCCCCWCWCWWYMERRGCSKQQMEIAPGTDSIVRPHELPRHMRARTEMSLLQGYTAQ